LFRDVLSVRNDNVRHISGYDDRCNEHPQPVYFRGRISTDHAAMGEYLSKDLHEYMLINTTTVCLNHAEGQPKLGTLWKTTRSLAIAEARRDASCQLKFCQLPRNSAETTCTTSPEQIEVMTLES